MAVGNRPSFKPFIRNIGFISIERLKVDSVTDVHTEMSVLLVNIFFIQMAYKSAKDLTSLCSNYIFD